MWTPTHAQVTVHRARNLVPKGKGGTNDAYVTIQLGKDKYHTSVKERTENPEWHEECDMFIGEAKEVHLNVFHRSFLGLDDFLGNVSLPLDQFQIYERPRSRWYALKGRPGKKGDTKYRGEIECKVTFVVQSKSSTETSETLRRAGSIKNLANTVTEKLKLPVRSSSFKDKDDNSKKKKAFVEPLVRSPSDKAVQSARYTGASHPGSAKNLPSQTLGGGTDLAEELVVPEKPVRECAIDVPQHVAENPPRPSPPPKRIYPTPEPSRDMRPRESLTAKRDQLDTTPEAFKTISLPPIRSKIGTIREQTEPEPDPKLTPLQKQNRQLSFSEADLNRSWRNTDAPKKGSSDEIDGLIRYKQPLYKVPGFTKKIAPLLKRSSNDAESKSSPKEKSGDTNSRQLKDSRELTKSLSRLDEQMESPTIEESNLHTSSVGEKCRTSLGNIIPESIPEETTGPEDFSSNDVVFRSNSSFSEKKDLSRRHTLQFGADKIEVATHDLQEVSDFSSKSSAISPELLEEYRGITREELIKLVHTQKNALYTRDMYIRDLENYIDNLLVRVMENTPRILQNPFRDSVTLVMTPASEQTVKTAPTKRKSGGIFRRR